MVQAHGVLLVLAEPHGQVVQVSANLPEQLGWTVADVLGHGVDRLGGELAHAVRHWTESGSLTVAPPRRLRLTTATGEMTAVTTMHRPGTGRVIVELEDLRRTAPKRMPPLTERLTRIVARLSAAHSIPVLADLVVDELRDLTGFDRVVVHRFDEAGHAEVIAESHRRSLVAHLHRRVPAATAAGIGWRRHLRQRTRLVVDTASVPVPMVPPAGSSVDEAPDLTATSLLAPTAAEAERFTTDGVAALFDASLVHEGRVWGLIHCTHAAPRYVACEVRAAVELIAEVVSTRISALEHYAEAQAEVLVRRLEQRLIEATAADGDWRRALFETPRQLLQPLGATGAALRFDGEIHTTGDAPPVADLQRLFAHLDAQPAGTVFSTASIAREHPPLAGMSRVAAGVLAIRIGAARGEYLAWFRREQPHDVTWAGPEPRAGATAPVADATWREHVRDTALPWRMRECAIAKAIGASIADIVTQLRAVRVLIAEQQLARMRAAVESTDEPVVITDADGDIVLLNAAVGRLIGGPHRQLETLEDLAAAFDQGDATTAMLQTLLVDRRPWRGELRLVPRGHDAGTPVALRADPIPGVDGGLLGVIVMLTDLSERHAAELARERLQRTIFAAQQPGAGAGAAPPAPPTVQALVAAIWANAGVAVSEIADSADAASIAPLLQEVEAATEHAVRLSALLGRFTLDAGPSADGE